MDHRTAVRRASYILGPLELEAGPGGDRVLPSDFGQNVNPAGNPNSVKLTESQFPQRKTCFHCRDFLVNPCTSLLGIAV